MALIPIEGLGAPSQKTSLLGGVAKSLYTQDHPHIWPMWNYLFDPNPNMVKIKWVGDDWISSRGFTLLGQIGLDATN